jgi:putative Ca2+/H+ antiporter (TMEM165/GDT1 family)
MCVLFVVCETQPNIVQIYATVLSLLAVFTSKRWSLVTRRHANTVYLLTFLVFAYRDLYPLTTFHKRPLDIAEGMLLWVKIGILFFVSILMPIITPNQYTPFDPKVGIGP